MKPAPLLVLGVGNPSRGDDALGPMFIEQASALLSDEAARGRVELLTDFQLQVEHALDLTGRSRVVFVDASVSATPPFEYTRVAPRRDASFTSHAMSPEAVLEAHRATVGEPPEAWLLAIRGERFELGEPLSERARAHLDAATTFFVERARGDSASIGGRRIEIEGIVQGVGFRPWVHRTAQRLGLGGAVRNTSRGVTIEAFGQTVALDALVLALRESAPAAARIRAVRVAPIPMREAGAFTIAPSDDRGPSRMALPADLATCDACLENVRDPADRHHRYVFTSCAECGPRFSIARALPYDRSTTSMAELLPCEACRADYGRPDDRRFHAQTIACPACGPRAWIADPRGAAVIEDDVVEGAAKALLAGSILGVQGIGAFHLACDATSPRAVGELRRRKRRDAQPFAVMVADVRAAEAIAVLDDASRDALRSPARPIVLAPSREGAIAPEVNGPSRRTGVMLPYTPLLHRLCAEVGRPLVVTSGNPHGGPAVIEHAEAFAMLGGLVDAFVLHDRPIVRRVEDSVVTGARVLRRSRGFAPSPIRLPVAAREPVLAVGGHMKNTACLVVDDLAYLTPHLGDLETVLGEAAWRRDVEGLERLLGVRCEVLAHDLHPDYATTRYALARPARRRVGVQHHVAHVQAAIAEHHVDEPVVGIAFDGSGFGPDGTVWGAEILLVDGASWTRAGTFRPLSLAGGERAIRDVWRVAFAALRDAYGGEEALALAARLDAFQGDGTSALATIERMLATGTSTVQARGMGRWFDAVGALVLGLRRASFDGHVAMALEEIADTAPVDPYPIEIGQEVDPRPTVRAIVSDVLGGVSSARVAARFHETVIAATSTVVARVLAETSLRRVVLAGGCLQNRLLERGLVARLGEERVVIAREVPVNDGGLALGQAYAAVLALAAERDSA